MQNLKLSLFPDLAGLSPRTRSISVAPFKRSKTNKIIVQLEYRKPPVKLTESVVKTAFSEYNASRAMNMPSPASVKRSKETPKLNKTIEKPFNPENFASLETSIDLTSVLALFDTKDRSIVEQMQELKEQIEKEERISFQYFLPNPLTIDASIFYEKMITYFLNPFHKGKVIGKNKKGKAIKSSSGDDKSWVFNRITSFNIENIESLNACYNWFVEEIYNYETTLQAVKFTQHGIQASYFSAFIGKNKEGEDELMYMRHVW